MLETIFWIITAFVAAVWFFSLLEGWADIGTVDHEDEPEDP